MIYTLPINIAITVGLFAFIIGFYLLINSYVKRKKEKLNKLLLLFLFLLLFVFIVGAVTFGLYIWGVNLQSYLINLWDQVGSGIIEKLGAIVSTILIFVVSGFIIKLFKAFVVRSQKYMRTANEKRKYTITKITSSIVNYVVYVIALLLILSVWGVNVLPALAGLGILGLVVGLGAQDLIKDIIAGFFIVFEKHFDVGDMVRVGDFKGEVIDIGLKTTRIKNWTSDVKIFNNSSVENVTNYSVTESLANVEFGIAYDADVDKTLEILNTELPKLKDQMPEMLEEPVCVGVISLADSSVNMRVVAVTKSEAHYGVERFLRKEIKKILDNAGIEIPFPQRVLHYAKDKIKVELKNNEDTNKEE